MSVFTGEAILSLSGVLLAGLVRSCVGGGLFIVIVWFLCRCCPRLPAGARFLLWWFACAKMLVGFLCSATVNIPVAIPTAAARAAVAATAPQPRAVHLVLRQFAARPAPLTPLRKKVPASVAAAATASAAVASNTLPLPAAAANSPLFFISLLPAAFWIVGVVACLVLNIRAALPLRRLLQNAIPVLPTSDAHRAAQAVGLKRMPRIVVAAEAPGLFVAGLWRPALVLPQDFGDGLTAQEIQMALVHEMAHLKRGDLLLGILPAFARVLFWFFPLAHLACRECAVCREEACDAAALAATGVAPLGYAQLLLKMVAQQQEQQRYGKERFVSPSPAGMPMAAVHFRQVKRRLVAMQRRAGKALRIAGVACVACGMSGILPWRVFAVLPRLEDAVNGGEETLLSAYTLTDLGTLGGRYSDAYGINDNGNVVGTANVYPLGVRGHAFAYQDGRMHDLTAGSIYRHSVAFAMNERGQAAATAFNNRTRPYAFLWENGKRRYLGSLPGLRYSRALDINENGMVAGTALAGGENSGGALPARAFLWQNGQMRDLGTLGGAYSHALAINAQGQVVGKADVTRVENRPSVSTHAFLYDGGGMRDLGTLPGGQNSLACDINQNGQVVGFSETGSGTGVHAFLYENGMLRDLGVLDGEDGSIAYAVSDSGAAVGASFTGSKLDNSGERRAVLWLPAQNDSRARPRPVDLNTVLPRDSGWMLQTARGINRAGQIVGQGVFKGQRRAFLLTPR